MGRELFLDFFTEHEVPVIRKRRHTFLNWMMRMYMF